jgi:hypothetical protein
MEPLGLVTSIASLAEIALSVLTNLNTFYRKARGAPKESQELRDRLDLLVDLLAGVRDALDEGPSANRSGPPLKEFDEIARWLFELRKRTTPQRTSGVRQLHWPFLAEENKEYISQIDYLKGSLDTRMGTQTLYQPYAC